MFSGVEQSMRKCNDGIHRTASELGFRVVRSFYVTAIQFKKVGAL